MTVHPAVRVGYLGGLGRSGTTLLARLLGALPGVCSVGEIVHLWERGVAADERCGCGKAFHDCEFWTAVGERAFGGWHALDLDRVRHVTAAVERTRHVPRLAHRVPRETHHLLTEHLRIYERLYSAVSEVSGCPVVVDASKHSALAFCLRWSRRLDLRVLHCVRDSRAVANSWLRTVRRPEVVGQDDYMPVYPPARTAALWCVENAAFELLGRRGTPLQRVRYEDFVRDPMATARAAADFLGTEPPAESLVSGGVAHLGPSHSVSGNPMRFVHGDVEIASDDAWHGQLAPRSARLVSALTLPQRVRYGYR